MKGILLSGGSGTRLYPTTLAVSKQLLPVYDKPMIYYPLSTLMMAGIRDVLIISSPRDLPAYRRLLGTGRRIGMRFSYAAQAQPRGIADALIIGESFIGSERCALILGDNIFHGKTLQRALVNATVQNGAVIFGYTVEDPCDYGIIELGNAGRVLSIEEKPAKPRSALAATGLYFYPPGVAEIAKRITPSERGELEITSINQAYLERGELVAYSLGPDVFWSDAGTYAGLSRAAEYVKQAQQQEYVGCIEQVAASMGYISLHRLSILASELTKTEYGHYLELLCEKKAVHYV